MKTAMQELIWLMSDGNRGLDEASRLSEIWKKAHQLLMLEKKQIKEANLFGYTDGRMQANGEEPNFKSSEDYYSQTFGE